MLLGLPIPAFALFAVGSVGWFCFALLAWWYWIKERNEKERIQRMKADVADMMLLFQTMRDVVSQQKKLAADFNQEIETKVGGVKKILATALEKNEKLYERQRGLEQYMEDLRTELQSVQRQIAYAGTPTASDEWEAPLTLSTARPDDEPTLAQARDTEPFTVLPDDTPAEPAPAPEAPAPPPSAIRPAEAAKPWEAADFEALADETPLHDGGADEEEELGDTTIQPADAQAARDAFRALLSMSADAPTPTPEAGNGHDAKTSVQERVVEYARAGMNVGQIATELGIGKGEVRLMLSLAKLPHVEH
ncbi:MAG: hypothetical protein GC168_01650 [Candidatus Hydrogenedens sp.]|nr:hypothetical protein [Candidatus Hydrogenedens sp.]